MAESTLAITFQELKVEVADFLGLKRDPTKWSQDNVDRINSYIKGGLRQFYFPPQIRDDTPPHKWSFLTPTSSITLVVDQDSVLLPDDFGTLVGPAIYFSPSFTGPEILITGEGQIRQLQQGNNASGRPRLAAVRPKRIDGIIGQRWELVFDRKADQAYEIYYRYSILPNMLVNTTQEYPYGGTIHGQTILASCLAEADLRMNGVKGEMWRNFIERLTASIEQDYQLSRTHFFGYNGNEMGPTVGRMSDRPGYYVQVNGVNPWDV